MHSTLSRCTRGLLAAAILATAVGGTAFVAATPAEAQSFSNMSCSQLWYARNAIYARRGQCFKTERARATFGPRCYPPYGALRGWEQREVDRIQQWEARKGC